MLCSNVHVAVQETAAPLPSPSNAFLIDAVNASGLASTPGQQTFARTVGHAPDGHMNIASTISEVPNAGPGSDSDPAPNSLSAAYAGDAVAPSMHAAFANMSLNHPNLQLPQSALLIPGADGMLPGTAPIVGEAADRGAPQPPPAARTLSKSGTPRSLHAVDSGAAPTVEPDVHPNATPKTPVRNVGAIGSGSIAGGATLASVPPTPSVSTSAIPAPKKKKASDMSKAERRALQEEQRAKKAAAKDNPGAVVFSMLASHVFCSGKCNGKRVGALR